MGRVTVIGYEDTGRNSDWKTNALEANFRYKIDIPQNEAINLQIILEYGNVWCPVLTSVTLLHLGCVCMEITQLRSTIIS